MVDYTTHEWSNTSGVIRVKRPKVLYEWCGKSRFSKKLVKIFEWYNGVKRPKVVSVH